MPVNEPSSAPGSTVMIRPSRPKMIGPVVGGTAIGAMGLYGLVMVVLSPVSQPLIMQLVFATLFLFIGAVLPFSLLRYVFITIELSNQSIATTMPLQGRRELMISEIKNAVKYSGGRSLISLCIFKPIDKTKKKVTIPMSLLAQADREKINVLIADVN